MKRLAILALALIAACGGTEPGGMIYGNMTIPAGSQNQKVRSLDGASVTANGRPCEVRDGLLVDNKLVDYACRNLNAGVHRIQAVHPQPTAYRDHGNGRRTLEVELVAGEHKAVHLLLCLDSWRDRGHCSP